MANSKATKVEAAAGTLVCEDRSVDELSKSKEQGRLTLEYLQEKVRERYSESTKREAREFHAHTLLTSRCDSAHECGGALLAVDLSKGGSNVVEAAWWGVLKLNARLDNICGGAASSVRSRWS